MANQIDFIVRQGLQALTNVAIGQYATVNAAPQFGMIVSGNVGIGTATVPAGNKLAINGNIILSNVATSGVSGIRFADGTFQNTSAASFSTPPGGQTDSIQYNAGGVPPQFGGSANLVYHPGNVHVGIGTNRANYALHVVGNDGPALFSTLNGVNYQIGIGTAAGNAIVGYNGVAAVPYAYISTGAQQASPGLIVTNTGNVGIGTTTALNALDVDGSVALGTYAGTVSAPAGSLLVSGQIGVGDSNPAAKLSIVSGAGQNGITITGDATPGFFLRFFDNLSSTKFSVDGTGAVQAGVWNGTAIAANYGGTGLTSYSPGDLLYATSDPNTLSRLASTGAGIGAGNVLLNGGASPYWGSIALNSNSAVSGVLPISNGGTNASSFQGNAFVTTAANGLSMTGITSATNAAVVFNNSGVPTAVTGAPYTYLTTGAGGGNLSFGKIDLVNGVSGTLTIANGGTGIPSIAQYALLVGSGNATAMSSLATTASAALVTGITGAPQWTAGTVANRVLRTDGSNITFAQVALTTDVTGVLPYANGGTNTNASFTQGSVIFAGATGFAQDNANLYWDDANNRLGLGTTAPTTTLDVNGVATIRNGANVVAGGLYVQAGTGNFAGSVVAAGITSNSFVNGASVYSSGAISAVGTITGANIQGNTWVRSTNFYGSGTINTDGAARFASITSNAGISAASIYSSGGINSADGIIGDTIASNTTINAGGTVFVGALISNSIINGGAFQSNSSITANTFVANTSMAINGTAESFNTLTGALTVAGGVGIASNLHVGGQTVLGGNVTIAGNLTVLGNATIINTEELSVEDPLIQIGTGPAGQPLQSDDGLDRGIIMHQYRAGSGGDTHSYLGREDSSGRLLFITNVQPGAANIANPIRVNSPGYHWGTANFGNLILSGGANAVSVSTSTGALVLEGTGGAGIGGGLHVGEYAYVGLGFNTGGTATVNRLISNTAISAGTTISSPGQISGGSIVSNSSLQTNTLTANAGAYIGGGLNVVGTITAGGLVLNTAVTFSNISASGTISGNVLIGNVGVYSGGNINAVNTIYAARIISNGAVVGTSLGSSGPISAAGAITGASLTSNSFINGTSINSSGPLSAAGTITGANIVSNGFVQGTSLYSSGPISAAGTITGASLTSNGLTSTSTFYASGAVNGGGGAIFNSVTSNTFIVGASISSSGAISAAGTGTFANVTSNGWVQTTALNSSGAITGANLTSNGFIFGSSLNTSGTATVNALVSNGVVSGASISTAGSITGGTINGALLVSNAGISAGTTVSAPGQITGGSIVSNSSVTGNVLTANSAVNTLALNATGSVRFTSGNTTTSSTTGALVVTGGIATGNNLFVAGSTWTGNIAVTNATASTSRTTGALVVAGGVGINGALFVGETLDARSITNTAIGNIVPSTGQFTSLITQQTATVASLVSNSFINGTSINSSGPISAAGNGTFANVTSNGFVNGASVYSSGAISAAGTITANRLQSNTAVVGATIQGSTSMLTGTFVANTSVTTQTLLASGTATVNSLVTNTSVTGNTFVINGNVATTSTTGAVILDTFAASEYRTAHYLVQVTDNTALQYHSTQIFLIHNGTNVYQSEYNLLFTDSILGTFDSSLVSGQIALTFTAAAATNKTIKVLRTGIEV